MAAAAGTYGNEIVVERRGFNWSAVWGGVFTFMAIESVFGVLGVAVFASAANPNAAHPVSGMSVGEGIWAVILTIIAMYVGGYVTGRLSAVTTRQEGAAHGQAMFGLSVTGVILLLILASVGMTTSGTAMASSHNPYILGAIADIGWGGFIALFLGWLGAMLGASQGQRQRTIGTGTTAGTERPVQQIRNVA
jgi:uncharacterized protein YacL